MPLTVEQFTQRLTAAGVMSEESLLEALSPLAGPECSDGEQLARELVKRKVLTKFQAEQIYAGKEKSLTLGNYVLLDKLGQGGMGMVLKAQHKRMKRVVALKVMSPAAVKSAEALKRFHREVEAAAKLTHPNIVTAFDADEAKGTHFLVMEFVDGDDLSALVKKSGPLPVEMVVQCIIQAARGLEFAHQQGVIHRDIKPANLLIDAKGTVKILDMGLARIDGAVGGTSEGAALTNTGTIMGTVDYMSPEQAMDSKHADIRSDIYSLGCSLYYLLTGKAVYDGDTMMKKLMAHRESAIPSLVGQVSNLPGQTKLSGKVENLPHEIDAVFQRMVAKRPDDRPQSMTEVIVELERCLSGASPTVASSQSSVSGDALQNFLREISGDAPSSTTSGAGSKSAKPKSGTVLAEDSASAETLLSPSDAETDPRTEQTIALSKSGEPMGVSTRTGLIGRIVRGLTPSGSPRHKVNLIFGVVAAVVVVLAIVFAMRTPSGTLHLEIADEQIAVTIGNTGRVVKGATTEDVRLPVGEHQLHVERDDVAFDTQAFAVTKGETVSIKVDQVGRRVRAMSGSTLLGHKEGRKSQSDGSVARGKNDEPQIGPAVVPFVPGPSVMDALRREDIPAEELKAAGLGDPAKAPPELVAVLGESRGKHWSDVTCLAVSPDGRLAISGSADGTIKLWEVETGREQAMLNNEHTARGMHSVSIGHDNKTVAFCVTGWQSVLLWDGVQTRQLSGHIHQVNDVLFSPDKRTLASAGSDSSIKLWDAQTGTNLATLPGHTGVVRGLSFNKDGSRLASSDQTGAIKVWDVAKREVITTLPPGDKPTPIVGIALSPDGLTLAANRGAEVTVWNVAESKLRHTLKTPEGQFNSLAFSPDGQSLAAGGINRLVSLWNPTTGELQKRISDKLFLSLTSSLAFTPNGRTLIAGDAFGLVRFLDATTLEEKFSRTDLLGPMAIGDGRTLASTNYVRTVTLWSLATARPTKAIEVGKPEAMAHYVALSPDGRNGVSFHNPPEVRFWDAETGLEKSVYPNPGDVYAMQFSPSGKWLAIGSAGGAVKLWEMAAGQIKSNLGQLKGHVYSVAWSSDERIVAAASNDNEVKLWDVVTGKDKSVTANNNLQAYSLAFSPDGRTLAAGRAGLHLFNATTLEQKPLLLPGNGMVQRVRYTPDGRTLVVLPFASTIYFLNAATGETLTTWQLGPKSGRIHELLIDPTGRYLITHNGNRTAYILRLPSPLAATRVGTSNNKSTKLDDPAFQQWLKETAALPKISDQTAAVAKKLQELNPEFDGKFTRLGTAKVGTKDAVTEVQISNPHVFDLSPMRVWPELKTVECTGIGGGGNKNKLSDLSPLTGLKLTSLVCYRTQVSDLAPLAGMPLTKLWISETRVSTLSPIEKMPLTDLDCSATEVRDLTPLRGMSLVSLNCHNTPIADLTPLHDCKQLTSLNVKSTQVTAAGVAALQKSLPNCKIEWGDPAKPK